MYRGLGVLVGSVVLTFVSIGCQKPSEGEHQKNDPPPSKGSNLDFSDPANPPQMDSPQAKQAPAE